MNYYSKYIKYKLKYNLLNGGGTNVILSKYKDENIKLNILHCIIKKYFKKYTILNNNTENSNKYKIHLLCDNNNLTKITIFQDKNSLAIDTLMECNIENLSGTKILNNIILFARELKIDLIVLADASNINNKLNLIYYYILLHGRSWYNKFGFISCCYENEKYKNKIVQEYSFDDYLDESINNYQNFKKAKLNRYLEKEISTNYDKILEIMEHAKKETNKIKIRYNKDKIICNTLKSLNYLVKNNPIECNLILTKDTSITNIIKKYDIYRKKKLISKCSELTNNIADIISLGKFILYYNPILELKLIY
jgi:hypothetical protein